MMDHRALFDIEAFRRPSQRSGVGKAPAIKKPREIACFSYDDAHTLHVASEASLRYYYPAFQNAPGAERAPISLREGYESFSKRDEQSDEHLDALLATLIDYEQKQGKRVEVDFITWRGMMTKFLVAPFDFFSDFEMNATCYQGTIYIEENYAYKQDQRLREQSRPPPRNGISQEEMQFWGYKFETLSSIPRLWADCTRADIEKRHEERVSNHAQFCAIVQTEIPLDGSSIIMGGEIDAIQGSRPNNPNDSSSWVEFKTTKAPNSPKDHKTYERKLLTFWAQSFLLNIPKIVIGFRSEDGYLVASEELETLKLPSIVKNKLSHSWDGNSCLNFSAQLLAFLKATIKGTGVWRIKRKKDTSYVEVFQVETTGTGGIISQAFKQHRKTP